MQLLPAHLDVRENLAVQTALVAGASAFVGTYGGFSYLAPFLGVRDDGLLRQRRRLFAAAPADGALGVRRPWAYRGCCRCSRRTRPRHDQRPTTND